MTDEIDPQIDAQLPDYIRTLYKLIDKAKKIKELENPINSRSTRCLKREDSSQSD